MIGNKTLWKTIQRPILKSKLTFSNVSPSQCHPIWVVFLVRLCMVASKQLYTYKNVHKNYYLKSFSLVLFIFSDTIFWDVFLGQKSVLKFFITNCRPNLWQVSRAFFNLYSPQIMNLNHQKILPQNNVPPRWKGLRST